MDARIAIPMRLIEGAMMVMALGGGWATLRMMFGR